MDAPIPLWRTGVHALATDHGCKAKATGESSPLCGAFVMVLINRRFRPSRVGLPVGSLSSVGGFLFWVADAVAEESVSLIAFHFLVNIVLGAIIGAVLK